MAQFRLFGSWSNGSREHDIFTNQKPLHLGRVHGARLEEALIWLQDEDRPGLFTFQSVGSLGAIFYFTDEDVAFETKMLWG